MYKVRTIILCFALIGTFSCNNTSRDVDNIFNFREYINYTTSGVISTSSPIVISLQSHVEDWAINQVLSEDIVSIQPNIAGDVIALSANKFQFVPSEKMKPATEYSVTVHLDEIYKEIDPEYRNYTFQFKTITPNFHIRTDDVQSYDKEYMFVNAVLQSADQISLKEAKEIVEATVDGNSAMLTWNSYHSDSDFFEFKIDSIQRNSEDQVIELKWNGKPLQSDSKGSAQLAIPGKSSFTIIQVRTYNQPEQNVQINFSDPLEKNQNFNGLVEIENSEDYNFITDGNILRVYPKEHMSGEVSLEIFEGIKSIHDVKLQNGHRQMITFVEPKPAIRILKNGSILPNSQDLKFSFEAVNVSAVDLRIIKIFEDNVLQFLQENQLNSNNEYGIRQVGRLINTEKITLLENESENTGKWKAYSVDLSSYFTSEPGAIYRVELEMRKEYAIYDCSNNLVATNVEDNTLMEAQEEYTAYQNELSEEEEKRLEEQYWDNLNYQYRNRNYNWNDRNNPCKDTYYYNKGIGQNLLASNIGVIAKQSGNGEYFFAVSDILTCQAISGATIDLYNYQQQKIASGLTDGDGFETIEIEKQAYFAIVSNDNNVSYIQLSDGNALSMSHFDVAGQSMQDGLKAFIYGERGVWRPGDTLHLNVIVNDVDNPLPDEHPIKIDIVDPNNRLVFSSISSNDVNGFYYFKIPTSTEFITGNYYCHVSIGPSDFSKLIKIENVKPNRLKVTLNFEEEVITKINPLQADLKVKWLHGADAQNMKTEVKAKLSKAVNYFDHKGFNFNDPIKEFDQTEMLLFDGSVNENGIASISKSLNLQQQAPGILSAKFLTRAFEPGGDISVDSESKYISPYSSYVGLKVPSFDGYRSYVTNTEKTFEVLSVNPQGEILPNQTIQVKIYSVQWRWWWNSSRSDLSSYVNDQYHKPYKTMEIETNAEGKGEFTVNIPEGMEGSFLIRAINEDSKHSTGRIVYFYKNWYQSSSGENDAPQIVALSSDKDNYSVGDKAIITFPSSAVGKALLSIENGSSILNTQWVKTEKGETKVEISITEEMTPNVYISLSQIQTHASTANDLPLRLYGVLPLEITNSKTLLSPVIDMADELSPEESYEITISEENNRSMTYTLAVVDEGLLDLTNYSVPDPHEAFNKKEALGVKTWDVYDDVIGAYGGSLDQVFAIGGDDVAINKENSKANRFKPVVQYVGPFELKKGQKKTHTLYMPNYVGSVKAMVVAGNVNEETYGKAEKQVPVKKPIMVLANLPRKLSPTESVIMPVTVFAMDPKVKTATVSLKSSSGITVVGSSTQQISFTKPGEQLVFFELNIRNQKGKQTIEVNASGHGENASFKVEIDVLNPNPITSKEFAIKLNGKGSQNLDFVAFGEPGTNSAVVEFSTMPPIDLTRRLHYLIRYPHGCVEQTTSSVFPQLYLTDILDMEQGKKDEIQDNVNLAIKKLAMYQSASGGFGYWPESNQINDWGTSYAGHFMLEAEAKGYSIPPTFKSSWINYQKKVAREWSIGYNRYNSDFAQAYRLYTLALAGNADLAAMNRLREYKELSNNAKWRLAAAYALAGQAQASDDLRKSASLNFNPQKDDRYYTYGSEDRNRAMALETMVLRDDDGVQEMAETVAKRLSSRDWMSTQTTAYCLLSISKMVEKNGGKNIDLEYKTNDQNAKINTSSAIARRELVINEGENQIQITNNLDNSLYAQVISSGKLPLGEEMPEARGLDVSVKYVDKNGQSINESELYQGQDVYASITVTNRKDYKVNDVALTYIIPSGWEIINTRFTDYGSAVQNQAEYIDIKDDRVYFYFDLMGDGKSKSKTFNLLLNASYPGSYYLPGLTAEAMYDHDFFVHKKGKQVRIVKEGFDQ